MPREGSFFFTFYMHNVYKQDTPMFKEENSHTINCVKIHIHVEAHASGGALLIET